jgi:hypothetical protein
VGEGVRTEEFPNICGVSVSKTGFFVAQVIKLDNIPILNLLNEFFRWDKEIRSQEFIEQFAIGRRQPIKTALLVWGGMPGDLMTLILQRAILGLESYVVAAVWFELGMSGRLTPELNAQVRNPFSIKPRQKGTAACYYNALPGLLDPKYSLETADDSLWHEVRVFYKNVRNKILHGYQIGSNNPVALHEPFDMIRGAYDWVNTWHTLELQDGGPRRFRVVFKANENSSQCLSEE